MPHGLPSHTLQKPNSTWSSLDYQEKTLTFVIQQTSFETLTIYRIKYIYNKQTIHVQEYILTLQSMFLFIYKLSDVTDFIHQDWNDKDFFYILYIFTAQIIHFLL